jgi:hypothetical protein
MHDTVLEHLCVLNGRSHESRQREEPGEGERIRIHAARIDTRRLRLKPTMVMARPATALPHQGHNGHAVTAAAIGSVQAQYRPPIGRQAAEERT